MNIVFISDGHFSGLDDPNQADLVKFLDSLENIGALAILGDLFDFWTGSNRVVEKNYRPALDALERVKKRGIDIIYLEGNHDFSMGPIFTERLKASVHNEFLELRVGDARFLLGHGDTVSMTTGYRVWRAFLRGPFFKLIAFAARPSGVWAIANKLSRRSRKKTGAKRENTTEKALREFAKARIKDGFDGVMLGHSHEAGVHEEVVNGKKGVYANPGSWAGGRTYLFYDGTEFSVRRWKG